MHANTETTKRISSLIDFKANDKGMFYFVVCAFCKDKAKGDAYANARHIPVSHGMCKPCFNREMTALKSDSL